ncbi:telomere repeats-binding bouquet formation protein 2 isoform X2 [Nycticebus coucang]|uniref:telomere repeats-binding bouquet formation protein 2 isoform X2 n=1 Tax=Nycticebus coucang TaxID=9470 RepID=UPI00234C46B4|nr:telomere repeats-binding bouquet formation protein 2 isoform X2 [Nycticebus coucang]
MFQGQSGWFCGSVSKELRQFWGRKLSGRVGEAAKAASHLPLVPVFQGASCSHSALASTVAEGGTISDSQAADFLFSSDASHPDTLRIYQSLEYIEDNATVFHAYYLSAVAKAEIKNSVALGHFILPPECLQKEIRRKIGSFIWEQDQHFPVEEDDEVTPNEIKTLRENSEVPTKHIKELSNSTEKHFIRTPVAEKQMYFPLQNYPVNNMVTVLAGAEFEPATLGIWDLHPTP